MGTQIEPAAKQVSAYLDDVENQHTVKWNGEIDTAFGTIKATSKENFLSQVFGKADEQLKLTKKWRATYYDPMWSLCDKAYYGYKGSLKTQDIKKEYRSNLRIRYAYRNTESQVSKVVPSILSFDPPVSVIPNDENSSEREHKARAAQKQLKYNLFQRQNAVELFINWVRQGEKLGLSPMKMYWAFDQKDHRVIRRPLLDEEGVLVGLRSVEFDEPYIIKDNPENANVNVRKFWWNTDAVNKDTLRYAFEEYWKPLSYIKKSPLYIASQTKNLSADSPYTDSDEETQRTKGQTKMVNTGEEMVRITERWDPDYLIVMANDRIIRYQNNPFDDGIIPYYFYRGTILEDHFPGMGTIEPMLDLEELANIIANQRIDNVHRIINRMLLVATSSGLHKKRLKFKPMAIFSCLNPDKVKPFPIEDVTQSAYIEQAQAESKMDDITGDPAEGRGDAPKKASESASMTNLRAAGAAGRIELKIWCAQFSIATMYRDMYRLEKQFGDPSKWISIMGPEGFDYNYQHGEVFVDDYEFDYTLGGYMGNRMADFQQFVQGLGILKDIPGVLQEFDPKEIAKIFAERANIRGIDRILKKPGIMYEGYYRDPYDENRRMFSFNAMIEVLPGELHTKHIPIHTKMLDITGLPEAIRDRVKAHYDQHMALFMEDQRAQGSVGGQVSQLQRMIGQAAGTSPIDRMPAGSLQEQAVNQAAGPAGLTEGGANARF